MLTDKKLHSSVLCSQSQNLTITVLQLQSETVWENLSFVLALARNLPITPVMSFFISFIHFSWTAICPLQNIENKNIEKKAITVKDKKSVSVEVSIEK